MLPNLYRLIGRGRQLQPPARVIDRLPMAHPAAHEIYDRLDRLSAEPTCDCLSPTCSLPHAEPLIFEPLPLEEIRRRIGAASHYRVKR